MNVNNNPYSSFKSYNYFKDKKVDDSQKSLPHRLKPYVGSALGVAGALLVSKKIPKAKNNTVNEVVQMLLMASSANIGGVIAGSIGADNPKKIRKKCKEAAFQMMNISIPMLMVSSFLEVCNNVKALNNNPTKIIASILGMSSGAALATIITNATREKGEPKRKYSIKDSIANFDDIVATIKIGFKDILKYIPVDKILPFIYIYSGARAGGKE